MKTIDSMKPSELRDELEAAVGTDLLSERYSGREKVAIMLGMVQRVRTRQERRGAGRPVCVLLSRSTCYACRKRVPQGKGMGLGLYGEYVLVHRKGGCAAVVQELQRKDKLPEKAEPKPASHFLSGYTPPPNLSGKDEGGFVNVVTNPDPITCGRCLKRVSPRAGLIVRHSGKREGYHADCAPNAARTLMGLPPLRGNGASPSCAYSKDLYDEHDAREDTLNE